MLKYTGREKDSDYKAFCQFIHLSIEPKIEDLEKKIAIKSRIIGSDIDDNIKAMMIDEVKENYHQYKEYEPEKVVHVAYSKAKETIEAEVAKRKDAEHDVKLAELVKKLEKRFDDQEKAFDEQLIEQGKKAEEKAAAAVVEAYKQGQADYAKELKEREINAKAGRVVKRNDRIKKSSIIVAWILLGAVAVAFVLMWVLGAFAEDSAFAKTYQQYDMQIAVGGVILDGLAWVWTVTIKAFDWFSTDKEAVLKKLKEQNP
jgi:tetratricopeptide (TPR) repeat protein